MDDYTENGEVYSAPPRRNNTALIIGLLAAAIALTAAYFVITKSRTEKENDHSEEMTAVVQLLKEQSSYPGQIDYYTGLLSPWTADDELISLGDEGEYNGMEYFSVNNDSDHFWTGTIRLYEDSKLISTEDIGFVMPHNYVYITEELTPMPNRWDIQKSLFVRFDYNEPQYPVSAYESYYDEDGRYYMAYAASGSNISYENAVSLAKRQYGMNILMNYLNDEMLIFNEDTTQMYDFGGYREYDPADASFKAEFDYDNAQIRIIEIHNGESAEHEWMPAR